MAGALTILLSNFSLFMFVLGLSFALLNKALTSLPFYECFFRWVSFFALGFTGFYTFVMHVFYSQMSAATIGWATSPFQFEVGMADLSLGLLGVLSFKASYGFRLASVIAALCMLWGDAIGHVIQMIANHNFAPGNAGSWFFLDILVPLFLLIAILKLKHNKTH